SSASKSKSGTSTQKRQASSASKSRSNGGTQKRQQASKSSIRTPSIGASSMRHPTLSDISRAVR
ncbi:hypothetical protein, partial [Legionella gresilensis]|uniref:hypothetical protein n=1 Tax=Legionella gresilensis TaxID=91823 RepID=UPI001A942488